LTKDHMKDMMGIQQTKFISFLFQACLVLFLFPFVSSTQEHQEMLGTNSTNNDNHIKVSNLIYIFFLP